MVLLMARLAAVLAAALGGSKHDPLKIGQTFMAGSVDPTSGSTGWALTSHGIAEKLFTVDSSGNIVGQVAQSVKKLTALSWEVTLKADYKFSDGTVVTAAHVSKALTKLNEVNSGAKASLGDMTVSALSALRLKIESERATPVMDAVLAEWPFVIFLNKSSTIYFTGPYAIEKFVDGQRFELVPNHHYLRAAERPLLVIKKFHNGSSLAAALERGDLDMAFHLPVDSLPKLRQTSGVTVKSFLVGYQYMMWHNTRRAPLSDPKVRKALDLAVDRHALTHEVRAGKATRSFFPENSPYHYEGPTELHGDKSTAETLLDEAGWVKNSQGKREKAGVLLSVHAVAYPQRPSLPVMLPVIKQGLEALGITVKATVTSGANWDELDAIMASHNWDLLLWAQHTLPAGDPQFFLSHFFRSDSKANHAGLNLPDVDNVIDALSQAKALSSRQMATTKAHKAIREQVPVSILMTPSWHVGLGSRLSSYRPWGSDYYVVHADFGLSTLSTTIMPGCNISSANCSVDGSSRVMLGGMTIASVLLLFGAAA